MITVTALVHAYSACQQGTRRITLDPSCIQQAHPVRLHPCATYTEGLQLTLDEGGTVVVVGTRDELTTLQQVAMENTQARLLITQNGMPP